MNRITITAQTKVGKSRTLEAMEDLYKSYFFHQPYEFVSAGQLMRKRADELGMSIGEFVSHMTVHPEEGHDKWVDDQIAACAHRSRVVVEGRVVHSFLPDAFHVLLECDMATRAERTARANGTDPDVERAKIFKRDEDDIARFSMKYPGCMWDPKHFHLRINTAMHSPDEIAHIIMREHSSWVVTIPMDLISHDSIEQV
jgi:cytidylate kinase